MNEQLKMKAVNGRVKIMLEGLDKAYGSNRWHPIDAVNACRSMANHCPDQEWWDPKGVERQKLFDALIDCMAKQFDDIYSNHLMLRFMDHSGVKEAIIKNRRLLI